MEQSELEGRVVFVTGAARGIGAACARRCAALGAKVVVADRREDDVKAVADALNAERAGSARAIALDIADGAGWTRAMAETESAFGRLDALVNNAGVIRVVRLEEADESAFRKLIDVNLVGTFLGLHAAIEPMKRAGGGSIVNFSSVQGLEGRAGFGLYSATKFGIRGLTRTAALELGVHGIRVNNVIPGPTRTKMTERPGWTDADYERAYAGTPIGRMAQPEEIAEMVAFLASPRSSYCTGADFVVDGGVLAGKT
ncbi:SDR family oxidoreductase [Myxococcota bacterium]|nr:SDR family oxidoreductase [Myxococcota bacterium]